MNLIERLEDRVEHSKIADKIEWFFEFKPITSVVILCSFYGFLLLNTASVIFYGK